MELKEKIDRIMAEREKYKAQISTLLRSVMSAEIDFENVTKKLEILGINTSENTVEEINKLILQYREESKKYKEQIEEILNKIEEDSKELSA